MIAEIFCFVCKVLKNRLQNNFCSRIMDIKPPAGILLREAFG